MIDQILTWFPVMPTWVAHAIWYLIIIVLLITFFSLFAGPVSWLERRIAGRIMSRIGPNRVGPQGIIQWLADGLKNFLKEDLIPADADKILFRFAPYPVFLGVTLILVTLPFSSLLIAANINVGILYVVGSWGLVVIGILAAGWASNNKWAYFGGMRSAAQMVSYEIPIVVSILTVVMMSGSLSLQSIIKAQGVYPWEWFVFSHPFAFIAFIIFFISAVAEGSRTPFDLPEAESELVAGYCVEYSGMRFLFFFFAEWGNLYIIGALAATLFLGGWQISDGLKEWALSYGTIFPHVLEVIVFQIKAWIWVLLIIQMRWTLPRLRVDQLMNLSWKYLTPFALICLLGTCLWMVVFPHGVSYVSYALVAITAIVIVYYIWRVFWHLRFTKSKLNIKWII